MAILFADVSGFTAMSEGLDHEDVNEIMRACWAELDRVVLDYGGTVDKHIGDALMATFGAVVAHEDDFLRAVKSALALQQKLAAFSTRLEETTGLALGMRCGIAAGEVTVDAVADSTHERSVIGSVVNLASRLEHECPVGGVLVSEDVQRATDWIIEYRAAGPRPIKGIQGLVPTYEAIAERDAWQQRPDRPGIVDGVLLGRTSEQASLRDALAEVLAGHGQVVALLGEAGLGKSTLAAAFRQVVEGSEAIWLSARAISYASTHPYALVREALQGMLGVDRRSMAEEVGRHLARELSLPCHDALLSIDGSSEAALDLRDRQALLSMVLLGDDLDSGESKLFVRALDPAVRHRLTLQAIRDLFVARSRVAAIVLNLEDIHWSDPESLEVAEAIATAIPGERVLLLVQARPAVRPDWFGLPHCRALELRPLEPEDCGVLIGGLLSGDEIADPRSLAARLHEVTRGNPYFIVEIVRSLTEKGALTRLDGQWALTSREAHLPATVRGLLQARIDSLKSDPKLVLQEASVVGDQFEAPTVEAIDSRPRSVRPALTVLVEKDFIQRRMEDVENYGFYHGLLRETAYQTLSKRRRERYHRLVGDELERRLEAASDGGTMELLAHHFSSSDRLDKAIHYALLAAEHSAAQYANESALFWYDRASEALRKMSAVPGSGRTDGVGQTRGGETESFFVRLLEGRAAVEVVLGEYKDARGHLEAALQLCSAVPAGPRSDGHAGGRDLLSQRIPELSRLIARTYWSQDDYDAALQWVDKGLAAARAHWEQGSVTMSDRSGLDDAVVARLCLVAGVVHWRLGNAGEATLWGRRALALADATGPSAAQDLAQTYNLLGILARSEGRPDESEAYCRESLARYEAIGDLVGADKALANLASALLDKGDLEASLEQFRRCLELARRIGDPVRQATAYVNMGEILIHRGDLQEALECYEKALPVFDRVGATYSAAMCDMNLSRLQLALGNGDDALARADAALAAFSGTGATNQLPEVLRYRALALLLLGRTGEALAVAEQALEKARELGRRLEEGQALRVLGQVRAGMGEAAEATGLFDESVRLLSEMNARYEVALTLLEHARLLAGATDAASRAGMSGHPAMRLREVCSQAAELFRDAGAAKDLAAAESLLLLARQA